jgi:bifunctional DNase/RNase
MIPVKVAGVVVDSKFGSHVVLLQEEQGEKVLPIFIGEGEAFAIAVVLQKEKYPRPFTLDLTKSLLDALGARVVRVIVSELRDDTYLASLVVEQNEKLYTFDARPSDLIGLALRASAPLFVAEPVMAAAGQVPALDDESRLQDMQERLRNANPEDIGDFKL